MAVYSVGDFTTVDGRAVLEGTGASAMIFPSIDGDALVVFGKRGTETFGGYARTMPEAKQAVVDWLNEGGSDAN